MLSLTELVQGSRLALLSKNRVAQTAVALAARPALTFNPAAGHEAAIVTQLDFLVQSPYKAGRPISRVGSLTTTATTYGTVATWTVAAGRSGKLFDISLDTDNFAKTNWQLTIGGVQQFTAFNPRSSLSIPIRETQLPPGAVVLLESASTDATSVVTYGAIAGAEFFDHIFKTNISKGQWLFQSDVLVTQELVDRGYPMWAIVTRDSPLILELTNVNGYGGEAFAAVATQYNLTRMEQVDALLAMADVTYQELAEQVQERLMDSEIGGVCAAVLRGARSRGWR